MTCATCGGRVLPDGDHYDPRLACIACGRGAYLDGAAPSRRLPRYMGTADALPRIRR